MSAGYGTPTAGELAGPWRLEREVGRGGHGLVFLATHREDGRKAAVKFLKPGLASPETLRAFEAERNALSRLEHPAIARLYDSGSDSSDRLWIAMEWVEGLAFRDFCDDRALPADERIALFKLICGALHHAHQKGVVHGDVRGPNLLVSDGQPKVVDFGLAGDSSIHDIRVDVLGLGEVLADVVSPDSVARARKTDLGLILDKATAPEVADRYPTASAISEELERLLSNRPVLARPPDLKYLATRFFQRKRAEVAGAAIVLVAVFAGLGASTSSWVQARAARGEAEQALQEVLLLSDIARVNELRDAAGELPAPLPAARDAYEVWLREAAAVLARLPVHRAALARAREAGGDAPQSRWQVEELERLITDLDRLGGGDAGSGAVDHVRSRLRSLEVAEQSLFGSDGQELWDAARRGIRESSIYGGLELLPQPGLVPLGPHPETGHWAFWHVPSGSRPDPDPERPGGYQVRNGGGMVLVLLPGGRVVRGAQSADPEGLHFDPLAQADESPVREVVLDPFFIGMHEMTRAQWVETQAWDPEPSAAADQAGRPVVMVDWERTQTALTSLGLELPTEAQWEYAARGGTATPFWTGSDTTRLIAQTNTGTGRWRRVGLTTANDFGLYDITGNAWEWTADVYGPYDRGTVVQPSAGSQPGTGRLRTLDLGQRTIRGGGNFGPSALSRVANRSAGVLVEIPNSVGIRPVRLLDPVAAR